MTSSGTGTSVATFSVKLPRFDELEAPAGWHVYAAQVPGFPIKPEPRARLREALQAAVDALRGRRPLALSTWLLMDSLHKDGAVRELSRHGREWMPEFGLGLWPDREPPRMYRDSDFLDLEFGQELNTMMHTVVQIGGQEEAARGAWETMFGRGSTVVTLATGGAEAMLEATREALVREITDESFQSFGFYFPLIGRAALVEALAGQKAGRGGLLDAWLGPVDVYVRESEEDGSVLVVSRRSAVEELGAAGFTVRERRLPEANGKA